mmetsp:Transcript_1646/g.6043  ORF Transcript_1646/g.6043 Transcript_1646/m.6043 type:complete len:424 (-) Transcript_1646:35-1306(-)
MFCSPSCSTPSHASNLTRRKTRRSRDRRRRALRALTACSSSSTWPRPTSPQWRAAPSSSPPPWMGLPPHRNAATTTRKTFTNTFTRIAFAPARSMRRLTARSDDPHLLNTAIILIDFSIAIPRENTLSHTLWGHMGERSGAERRAAARTAVFAGHSRLPSSSAEASVAIVVGAGPGIGRALCRAFGDEGFLVVAARRDAGGGSDGSGAGTKLMALETELAAAGIRCVTVPMDARDEQQVEALFDRAAQLGRIEVVVHNIGGNVAQGFLDTSTRTFRKVWELAALSSFLVARAGAKRLLDHGCGGSILFSAATASIRGRESFAAFSSAMHAKRAVAKVLQREVSALGIHVAHVVIDGPVDTAWVRRNFSRALRLDEDSEEARARLPVLLDPAHVAAEYVRLHRQPRSAWTFELDLRPWAEPCAL